MKLVDREPTEEMIAEVNYLGPDVRQIWEDMFNAAPEVKIDMEPVAWFVKKDNAGCVLFHDYEVKDYIEDGWKLEYSLYSAEQVVALQAENEMLKKTCEYNFTLYQDMGVKTYELAAERDKLLAISNISKEALEFYSNNNIHMITFQKGVRESSLKYHHESPYWKEYGKDTRGHEIFIVTEVLADEALEAIAKYEGDRDNG